MKRLESFLKKKVEEIKVSMKIKKVETALQTAKNNAEEQKIDAELKLQSIMESMADSKDITDCITSISKAFDEIDEAELTLLRIEKIKEWMNEEV